MNVEARMRAQAGDNSLADLAARIKAEHEAVGEAMKHAIAAGELLIEAKDKLPHGKWLPWLEANCEMSERTAQAYMRIARELTKIEPAKAQRVADLSVRDALRSFSRATGAARLSPEGLDRALAKAEADGDMPLDQTIRHIRRDERLSDLLPPQSMTPPSSPAGRAQRVAHNAAKRQWLLAIGPNSAGLSLERDLEAAEQDETIAQLRQEHSELVAQANALEAEAKALREEAASLQRVIDWEKKALVQSRNGPAYAFTETYDFQADEATDRELNAGPRDRTLARLLAARGQAEGPLKEVERGYWGDMNLMGKDACDFAEAPGGAWTGAGSPEWLDELFAGSPTSPSPAAE